MCGKARGKGATSATCVYGSPLANSRLFRLGGRASSGDVPIRGRIHSVVNTMQRVIRIRTPGRCMGRSDEEEVAVVAAHRFRIAGGRGLQATLAGEPLVEGQLVPLVPSARVRPCAREWRCAHALGRRQAAHDDDDDTHRRQAAGLTRKKPGGELPHGREP